MQSPKIKGAPPAATATIDRERWIEAHGDCHKFVPQGFTNHTCGPLEWKPEAEIVMHRTELWETFRNCLSKLPEPVADVFMLRELEEIETEQICRDLSISQNSVTVCYTEHEWLCASVSKSSVLKTLNRRLHGCRA